MKAEDVINRLRLIAPIYTDLFTDVANISSITSAAGVTTVNTATAHNLIVGKPVHVSGVLAPISQSTLTRLLTVGTIVTAVDHDLTAAIAPTITISGAADANFNGTFIVTQIVNRRTIKFAMADSGATSTTGGELFNAERYDQQYNGLFQVASVTSATAFTYADADAIAGTATTGKAKSNVRITGTATIERSVLAYTEQALTKAWLFVVIGDTAASKDRHTNTDLTSNQTRSNEYRQQLQELVSLVVISNTQDEIAAREMRDEMVNLRRHLTRSIAFHRFPTNMFVGSSDPLIYVRDGVRLYDGAQYIHQFDFEASTEMVFDDTVGFDADVAFRDISMTQTPDLEAAQGSGNMTADINLDEVEL